MLSGGAVGLNAFGMVVVYLLVWALRSRRRGAAVVLGLVLLQIAVAAVMVLLTVPPPLQAAHAAVGAAVWGALVVEAVVESRGRKTEAPAGAGA